jgi:hypothetical protein
MKSRKVILSVIIITSIITVSCSLFSVQAAAVTESTATPTYNPTLVAFGLTLVAAQTSPTMVTPEPSDTPTETATITPAPSDTTTPTQAPSSATGTPLPSNCYQASFVTDVTIPDGTAFNPGDTFTKTWRIKNSGVCQWNTNFKLIFDNGNAMSGPNSVNFPNNVDPGQTIDLSVNLVAPSDAGNYIGYWKLQTDQGVNFGLGTNGTSDFWVSITVNGATETPTDTPTPDLSVTPTPTGTLMYSFSTACDQGLLIRAERTPGGSTLITGTPFTETWVIQNAGACSWNTSFKLVFDKGNNMSGPNSVNFPANVDPGQSVRLSVNLVAPNNPGNYSGSWRMQTDQGVDFGVGPNAKTDLQLAIAVTNPIPTIPTPTSTSTPQFTVTGTNLTVNKSTVSVKCGPGFKFDFTGKISTNTGGTVTYYWQRSDGFKSSDKTLAFKAAGTQPVTFDWTLGNLGTVSPNPFSGWVQINIKSPNTLSSNQEAITLKCS